MSRVQCDTVVIYSWLSLQLAQLSFSSRMSSCSQVASMSSVWLRWAQSHESCVAAMLCLLPEALHRPTLNPSESTEARVDV